MGINPLMSMLSWIAEQQQQQHLNLEVQLLYGVRDPGSRYDILFLERIRGVFEAGLVRGAVRLFLTTSGEGTEGSGEGERGVPVVRRRMTVRDVKEAVGEDKEGALVYVCGVPGMTDEFVRGLVAPAPEGVGMDERRVLFEKWW
jgi:NAD(P)H-flavin reductase